MSSSIKELSLAFFKGLAFGKGLIMGRELAESKDMAEDRWITIHPWGMSQGEADAGEGKGYYRRIEINDETGEIEKGLGAGTNIKDLSKTLKAKKNGEEAETTSKQPKVAEPKKPEQIKAKKTEEKKKPEAEKKGGVEVIDLHPEIKKTDKKTGLFSTLYGIGNIVEATSDLSGLEEMKNMTQKLLNGLNKKYPSDSMAQDSLDTFLKNIGVEER